MPQASEVTAESSASVHAITRLSLQAVRCAPSSCGATATVTAPGGGRRSTATHPDLATLTALDEESGEGPLSAALASLEPVLSRDLPADTRWADFRAPAIQMGLRSCLTVPVRRHGIETAVTLYAFWPGALPPALISPVRLLADAFIDALVRDHDHLSAQLEVEQLRTAIPSRAVIDQASGIVMRIVGCDSAQAFALLRTISQRTNRKLSEIAAEVVRGRGSDIPGHLRNLARKHH